MKQRQGANLLIVVHHRGDIRTIVSSSVGTKTQDGRTVAPEAGGIGEELLQVGVHQVQENELNGLQVLKRINSQRRAG